MRLRLCILGFIALLLAMTSSELCTADSEFPHPFDIEFEPSTSLKTDEPVTMRLSIQRSEDPGKTIELDFSGQRGLTLPDGASRSAELDGDGKVTVEFDVVIPKGDTSSITVVIKRDYLKMKTKRWFVTTGESVRYWKAHPREANPEDAAGPPPGRRGRIIPGEFPDLDIAYGIPPEMIHPDYRPDSIPKLQIPRPTDAEIEAAVLERRRQEMREFEKTPLTGAGTQWIKIGDTMWTRRYGETKFRVAVPITDLEAHHQALRDSLLAIPPGTMYDVLYQVKDTTQVATLRKHIDNLEPTRRTDVFRCRISKALIEMLAERYRLTPTFVDQNPESLRELFDSEPSPDSGDSEPEGRLDGPDKGTEIFYSENYENGWPPSDTAWDELPLYNGADYWGISTVESYSGSRSIWCNGVGDKPDGGPYDDAMLAMVQNADPFIVKFWHDEHMRYQVWTDIPPAGFDFLAILFSTGNDSWLQMRLLRGTFGWTEYEDWFIGGDSLYFRFSFQSGTNTFYRGAYIDDVVLRGTPYPNLKPVLPDGWENPMVLSSEQGTHQTGTLYGEEPTYVDWAITNNQIGDAGPFSVGVFIGATLYESWPFFGLASGDSIMVEDAEIVFPVGEHQVELRVDYVGGGGGEVEEIMELDNNWHDTYFFEDARIGFQGYLYYTDPTADPDTTIPLRGYTITLWDHNVFPYDDSLASAETDDYGYFELGPVDNDDYLGTGELDVFFRIYSANEWAVVREDWDDDNAQAWQTPHEDDVPSGMYDTTMTASAAESGRFYVADGGRVLHTFWVNLPYTSSPGVVNIELNPLDSPSFYYPEFDYIHIETGYDYDKYRPNTYDRDVLAHEYTHVVQEKFGFMDSTDWFHGWDMMAGRPTAGQEGFAYFLACVAKADSFYCYYRDDFTDSAWYNLENGGYGRNDDSCWWAHVNNGGPRYEAAVACAFWDIYDDVVDDYSTWQEWPQGGCSANPDGVEDNMSDGIENILEVLLTREIHNHHPETLDEFWKAWFLDPHMGSCQLLLDVLHEHGDSAWISHPNCSCCEIRGDVNGDNAIDISDLVMLVDYMFTGGPAPECWAEANVDGSGPAVPPDEGPADIDISDLVMLVDYMFTGGDAPPSC